MGKTVPIISQKHQIKQRTCASGCLRGHQRDSAQAEQFEERRRLLVELTQLSFSSGQVCTDGRVEKHQKLSHQKKYCHVRKRMQYWTDLNSGLTPRSFSCSSCRLLVVLLKAASCKDADNINTVHLNKKTLYFIFIQSTQRSSSSSQTLNYIYF